jgi:hypothetical protein
MFQESLEEIAYELYMPMQDYTLALREDPSALADRMEKALNGDPDADRIRSGVC